MKRSSVYHGLVITLLLAATFPAFATPRNSKGLKMNAVAKGTFNVVSSLSVNGAALTPGEYKVIANESQVSFFRSGKLIAQAPIRWQDIEAADHNALVDNSGRLQEVRFKGKNRSIAIE